MSVLPLRARVLSASAFLAVATAIVVPTLASADDGNWRGTQGDKVCSGQHQFPGGDMSSVTVTAPDGKLISGYCVKAGSAQQGNGPMYYDVDPPKKTVTISHPSGKDISHYVIDYVDDKPDTTMPDTTQPDTTQPATTEPSDTTQPDTTQPATTEPSDTTQPDTTDTTAPATTTHEGPHDPPIIACEGLTIVAHGYDPDDVNTVTVTVNGVTDTFTFGDSVNQFYPFERSQANTWSYTIDAPGTIGDFAESGTEQGCTDPDAPASTDPVGPLRGELPATGASSTMAIAIGAALIAAGTLTLHLSRRLATNP